MEERQCGMCKKTKTIGAFRAKPNGTHTKTCISCLEKVKEKDTKRRAKDKTPPPAAPNQKNKTSKGVPPAEAECRPGDRQLTDGDLRLATVTSAREHDLLTIALTRNPARDRLEAVAREACVHRLLGILMSIHDELLRQIERGEFEHAE
jgi:hypothetical protein